MGNLPSARPSPRIVNGVIFWYAGDTFEIDINLDIVDQDGDEYEISSTDTVKMTFENSRHQTVATYTFTGIEDNNITLEINGTETAKFPKGEYTYKVLLTWEEKTTIVDKNKVVVE